MILHDWALDDRCYAVRLGAALMGRRLTIHTTSEAAVQGPVLTGTDGTHRGPLAILDFLARDTPWRVPTTSPWVTRADEMLVTFSDLRRNALLASMPQTPNPPACRRLLRMIEDQLSAQRHAGSDWIAGPDASIVDIALFPVAALSHDLEVPHDLFPELRRFIRSFRALPGFITMPGIPEYH
ncbi:glutathione S-transferase C-terminal domain-containing protein [Tanticharoenia sakaeratensis]|nr:glutathione S-transferase C-terminal domain-containing protein [Tanticharoenia sakaeratensis]